MLPSSTLPMPKNQANMLMRPASQGDLKAILALEEVCFEVVDERFNRRQIAKLMTNPRADVLVLEQNHEIIGWGTSLVREARSKRRSGRIYAIAVSPHFRGKGLGRLLAEQLLKCLQDRHVASAYIEVREDNLPALNLYKCLGFKDHAFLPDYYGSGRHGLRLRLEFSGELEAFSKTSKAARPQV